MRGSVSSGMAREGIEADELGRMLHLGVGVSTCFGTEHVCKQPLPSAWFCIYSLASVQTSWNMINYFRS